MGQLEEVAEMDSSWTHSLLTATSFTPTSRAAAWAFRTMPEMTW